MWTPPAAGFRLEGRRWEVAAESCPHARERSWLEANGSFLAHCCSFVGYSRSFEPIDGTRQATRVRPLSLGLFHALISDMPVEGLSEPGGLSQSPPLPGQVQRAAGLADQMSDPDVGLSAVRSVGEREWGGLLLGEARRGRLPLRYPWRPEVNNMP